MKNLSGCIGFPRHWIHKGLAILAVLGVLLAWYVIPQPPQLLPGPPIIIARSEWGAEPPDPRLQHEIEAGPEVFNTVVVHHTALPSYEGPRQIQYLHMHQRNFLDIGYHFVLDRWGRIYEARSLAVHGAHVKAYNTGTLGIALAGNYETNPPTPAQLDRLRWLIHRLKQQHPLTHLAGHRDFRPGQTLCPGKYVETLLPQLAADLELQFGTGGYIGPEHAITLSTTFTPSPMSASPTVMKLQ